MTPETIAHVQGTWAKVAPNADQVAEIFYGRLFTLDPSVRPLFPEDMKEQKTKLMQTLGVAVASLEKLAEVVPVVEDMGRRHKEYGVVDEHYATVGAALLETLREGLGDEFTPEVEDAWTEVYTTLADVMKTAAAQTV